jgi:hypothetical protein
LGGYRDPDWQPLPPLPPPDPGYPRPKGASPFNVSLVPAYRACESPNKAHGAPLSFGSCSPPQQESDSLTFGTPDANGAGAKSVGRVLLNTLVGNLATPENEADVVVHVSLSDVRCRVALSRYCDGAELSDYLGSLELAPTIIRISDRFNGGAERDPATMADWIQFAMPVPCSPTSDTTVGSTCSVATTLDTVVPGVVREGKRAVWQLGQIVVRDAGIDDPSVTAYSTLAVEGVFVP